MVAWLCMHAESGACLVHDQTPGILQLRTLLQALQTDIHTCDAIIAGDRIEL